MARLLLISAGVPVVSSAAVLLLSFLLGGSDRSRRIDVWCGAVAFGLSFFLSFCLINGSIPEFPPDESVNWIPYVALVAMGLGILEEEVPQPAICWGLRFLLAGLALCGTMYPLQSVFTGWELLFGGSMVLFGLFVTWWFLERFMDDLNEYVIPLAYLICSTAASGIILLMLSYGSMAQVAGAYSAICGVFLLFLFFWPSRAMLQGSLPGLMILLPLILSSGWYFGSGGGGTTWALLLLIGVPNVIWLTRVSVVKSRIGRIQRVAISAFAVLVVSSSIALVVWYGQSNTHDSGNSYDPYNQDQQEENEYDDYGY